MSAEIITMPLSADKAWEVYHRLLMERAESPALLLDRGHVERVILAYEAFHAAFIGGR